ncbi:patched domain-containing protein 3-like [Xenia sp. Carnegie-2017]|uniref:patched domain-containing protein 3-like n=1 Tax=Xenia sp. Carnegie-2017 TaxID=2897299 RepID=UPI001F033C6E|nr:patched domain-containing protein 3-like [Xenia sp. Carnegie-2017]XP_046840553.1 patched domain-containing protein 3-like [Xenia sp. Carnegie-2017]
MSGSSKESKSQSKNYLQNLSNVINGFLEKAFYRIGKTVGASPWVTLGITLIVCGACLAGLLRFEQESRGEKLWVPQDSQAQKDKKWVEREFPEESAPVHFIYEQSNVLTVDVIRKMLEIHQDVVNITITFENKKLQWKDICFKKGDKCSLRSILELWDFNETKIMSLTEQQIRNDITNRGPFSPYSGSPFNLEQVLADIQKNPDESIKSAGFVKTSFFYKRLPALVDPEDNVDPRGKKWEEKFQRIMEKYNIKLYTTRKKFAEVSSDAINGDIILLSSGYLIIFAYVIIILGKFTRLEIKAWLALCGIVSVGLSVGISIALCSAFGLFYGPAHTTLPFLLLGIGVDDLFVIVQSWSNIRPEIHKTNSVAERIGLTLKHAGVSITITTFTDLIAFLIGATTIIPGLRSFCFYAAVGIFCDYVLQITFFVACLSLDARRIDKRRDGCGLCIILPQDYKPNECGQKSYLQMFYEKIVGPGVVKLPVKIIILVIAAALLGGNIYGSLQLEQQFESKWFLPAGTVVRDYMDLNEEKFVQGGEPIAFYTGEIDYFKDQIKLHTLNNNIKSETQYLASNTVENWFEHYIKWLNTTNSTFLNTTNDLELTVNNKKVFYEKLREFLQGDGNRFHDDIHWKNNTNTIKATRIRAFLRILRKTQDQVKAMDKFRSLIEGIGFREDPIVYNRVILFAEGNKVISEELFRNILLALAVVFVVTMVIIASPVTSVLVFVCVVLTVVDVAGLMYFWDLTIDIVSTIVLIIAIGLSVDYASHVGHTFLIKSGTRKGDKICLASLINTNEQ